MEYKEKNWLDNEKLERKIKLWQALNVS
jgi:hypothetical protein